MTLKEALGLYDERVRHGRVVLTKDCLGVLGSRLLKRPERGRGRTRHRQKVRIRVLLMPVGHDRMAHTVKNGPHDHQRKIRMSLQHMRDRCHTRKPPRECLFQDGMLSMPPLFQRHPEVIALMA